MTCAEAIALAHLWAGLGVPVFPIGISWDETKQGTNKRPLSEHGHLDGTTSPGAFERLFNAKSPRRGEALGVGLWPGPAHRVVLDVDVKGGDRGDDVYADLAAEHGAWPDTPRVLTPSGGWHDWYTKPPGVRIGNPDLAPGINVRADDGWVVAPGTTTPWGSWEFEEGTGLAGDAPLPAWALERLASTNGHTGHSKGRWSSVDRGTLRPADLAALEALEALGGHDEYLGGDGALTIVRPGKVAGGSASIGYIGPGLVKVFTDGWEPLEQNAVYTADDLIELADDSRNERDKRDVRDKIPSSVTSVTFVTWETPAPLTRAKQLPAFPTDALPGWVKDYVEAVAHFTQTPVDLAATVALAAIATAIGGRIRVQVRGPWIEPTNLFTVGSLPPGSRKSAVFAALTKPLYDTEKELIGEIEPTIIEAETLIDIAKADADRAKRDAAKAETVTEKEEKKQEALTLGDLLAGMLEEVPPRPRLIADDITPEAAATLLADQGGRLGVLSAEGGIFSILAGRYSGVPNLDLFLKGHAGDALRVDRKSSSPIILDTPALTLGLTVQPEILRQIAQMPGFRGRGLLARILYCVPPNTVGWRQVGVEPPADEVANRYEIRLGSIAKAMYGTPTEGRKPPQPRADEEGFVLDKFGIRSGGHISACEDKPPKATTYELSVELEPLRLDTDAAKLILDAERALEPRLRPDGDLGYLADWASKLVGVVARIAGVIHAAETLAVATTPITGAQMAAAIRIGEYFTAHAVAAFDEMGADPAIEGARRVLDWVKQQEKTEFTRREAHRGCRQFRAVTELDPCLELLEHHGYIRGTEVKPERGGRPSRVYAVNPAIYERGGDATGSRRLDPAEGLQDAQLDEGARVHIVHGDIAPGGHVLVQGSRRIDRATRHVASPLGQRQRCSVLAFCADSRIGKVREIGRYGRVSAIHGEEAPGAGHAL